MPNVTLSTGVEVPSHSPEWAAECLARYNHVQTMLRLGINGRRDHLRLVAETDGAESRTRLEAAFTAAWKERNSG